MNLARVDLQEENDFRSTILHILKLADVDDLLFEYTRSARERSARERSAESPAKERSGREYSSTHECCICR